MQVPKFPLNVPRQLKYIHLKEYGTSTFSRILNLKQCVCLEEGIEQKQCCLKRWSLKIDHFHRSKFSHSQLSEKRGRCHYQIIKVLE